jgi:hypothetical protein
MFFKRQNKVNLQTHSKAGFSSKKGKEKEESKAKKDRNQRTTFSSQVVDTSFVYFEEN